MPLSLDHLATIESDAARIRAAYDANRDGRIPWSDRWTVRSVARHVAGAHHVTAGIIHGRPTADFGLLDSLEQPPRNDPGFPAWFAAGTDALCDALRSTDLDEPCWTSIPGGRTVRFWLRRITHETGVHRWDAEVGAGLDPAPFDAAVAADGVDEYLVLAVPTLRKARRSPAGPPVHIACTDAEGSWYVQFADDGGCTVSLSPVPVATTLKGPAAGLLLALYRRQSLDELGVELDGDPSILERRDEFLPCA
jgi:uncharacterized protein (TIGR03083 family)